MYLAVKEVKEGLIRGDEDPSKIHPPLHGPGPGHPLETGPLLSIGIPRKATPRHPPDPFIPS